MKFPRLLLVARRNFLVRPRTMSDCSFEQSTIIELVGQDGLEEIQIGNRFGVLQDAVNYKQTPEACLKRLAAGAGNGDRLLWLVAWSVGFSARRFRRAGRSRCAGGAVADARTICCTNACAVSGANARPISCANAVTRSRSRRCRRRKRRQGRRL